MMTPLKNLVVPDTALTYQEVDLREVGLSRLLVNFKLLIVSEKQVV